MVMIPKDEVRRLITERPKTLTPQNVIDSLLATEGVTLEGYNPPPPMQAPPTDTSVWSPNFSSDLSAEAPVDNSSVLGRVAKDAATGFSTRVMQESSKLARGLAQWDQKGEKFLQEHDIPLLSKNAAKRPELMTATRDALANYQDYELEGGSEGLPGAVGGVMQGMGEFMAPIGLAGKVKKIAGMGNLTAKLLTKLPEGAKKTEGFLKLGAEMAEGSTLFGALSAIREGEWNDHSKQQAWLGALIPPGLKVVQGALGIGKKMFVDEMVKTIKPVGVKAIKDPINKEAFTKHNLVKAGNDLAKTLDRTIKVIEDKAAQIAGKLKGDKYGKEIASVDFAVDQAKKKFAVGSAEREVAGGGGKLSEIESAFEKIRVNWKEAIKSDAMNTRQLINLGKGARERASYANLDTTAEAAADAVAYKEMYKLTLRLGKQVAPEVKALQKEISELIPIKAALAHRVPVIARNNWLSLLDGATLLAAANAEATDNDGGGYAKNLLSPEVWSAIAAVAIRRRSHSGKLGVEGTDYINRLQNTMGSKAIPALAGVADRETRTDTVQNVENYVKEKDIKGRMKMYASKLAQ